MKIYKPVLCKADKVRDIKPFNFFFFHYKFKLERFSEDKNQTVGAYVYIYIKLTDSGRCGYKNPIA